LKRPLPYLTRGRKTASLAFYIAFFESFTKEIFPQIIEAFPKFTHAYGRFVIEQAVAEGFHTAKSYAEAITRIYRRGKAENDMKWVEHEITQRFLSTLVR